MDEELALKTAVSLKGHDTGRRYAVLSAAGAEFVLVADGKYRKLDNPKLKRLKHLRIDGDIYLGAKELTDEKLKKVLKN